MPERRFSLRDLRSPLLRSMRQCALFGWFLWSAEVAWLLVDGPVPSSSRLHGLVASLGLGLLLAAAAGVALGIVRALTWARVLEGRAVLVPWWSRVLAFLSDPGAQARAVGEVLGASLVLAGFALCAYYVTHRLVVEMARPHFIAIAVVAVHLAIGLLALAVYPAARNAGILFARALGPRRILGWPFARAVRLLGILILVSVVAGGGLLVRYWHVFEYLPWRLITSATGALTIAAAFAHFVRPGTPLFAWFERPAGVVIALASTLALFSLSPYVQESRSALHDTLGGRLAYALALPLLDFDDDGHLGVFGGGDCAPFDGNISPVALDTPNNRRDEDCDGVDLDDKRLGVELRRNWSVAAAFPQKPSIVLITIDAFAARSMRALGGKRPVTPRLDALARESAFFENAFSQGPSTRLAFPSIFTSRWDTQIKQRIEGSHPYPIEDSETLLAEVLAREGYDTVAVLADGYFRKRRWGSLTAGFKEVIESPIKGSSAGHNGAKVTDAALEALARERKRPLFLWAHYYDAHSPHTQPAGVQRFGSTRADLYDAELLLVDREVGRLLDAVAARAEAPLLFVTGDHGIGFDRPRHAKFNYGYDLSTVVLHVPLMVKGPLVQARAHDAIVSTMDIAPTITNLLRVRRSLPFEGASLVPELLEGRSSRPQRVLHQFYLPERISQQTEPLETISLRTERYNLIHDRKRGVFELYDWRKDYFETKNLADSGAHRQALLGLKRQLALLTYRVYAGARGTRTASAAPASAPVALQPSRTLSAKPAPR